MREPPKACLNAADDDGRFFVALADQIAVDRHGVVRALSHEAAGRVCVSFPVAAGDGIVVHHRVHVPAHHKEAEARPPQRRDRRRVFPVRLADDADFIARVFKHAGDDGVAERRMVDIGVTDDCAQPRRFISDLEMGKNSAMTGLQSIYYSLL